MEGFGNHFSSIFFIVLLEVFPLIMDADLVAFKVSQ